jgi:hypothetical protein
MAKIFIDANVFLRFYEGAPEFYSLLKFLRELRPYLVITERVVAEVRRRKLGVAADAFAALEKKLTFQSIRLPEHLDESEDSALSGLNAELAALHRGVKKAATGFRACRDRVLRQIALSKDPISRALEELFEGALVPNAGQLDRANLRHLYGDPPGKASGALGDQISWEQLLDSASAADVLWLVTSDTDYFVEVGGEQILNAALIREVGQRFPSMSTPRVFQTLLDAVQEFAATVPSALQRPPSAAEAQAIREEEKARRGGSSTGERPYAWVRLATRTLEVLDSFNVSSVTETSNSDLVLLFGRDLPSDKYVVDVVGNGSVSFEVLAQSVTGVSLRLQEPYPPIVYIRLL